MDFAETVKTNRSYRRFDSSQAIEMETLEELVLLSRYCASAGNKQPLKYVLCADAQMNSQVYDCLAWAGYLSDWKGPEPEERPTGYIVVLGDHSIADNFYCDHGIAAQTILLGARQKGLGGCILAAINHKKLRPVLNLKEEHEILLVIALGKPVEEVLLEDMDKEGNIRYWRDDKGVHHVPKRGMEELIQGKW